LVIQSKVSSFQAVGSDGTVLSSRTPAIGITDNEAASLSVPKTKERAADVDGPVAQMESEGWTVTGKGADWFSVQLSR
jgi:hypothetical protein